MGLEDNVKKFNKEYTKYSKKSSLYFDSFIDLLAVFFTELGESAFSALELILVGIIYHQLFLNFLYPIWKYLIYKPLYIACYFAYKIAFGICDFVFAVVFSLMNLIINIAGLILRALLFLIDLILIPIAKAVATMLDYIFFGGGVVIVGIFEMPNYMSNTVVPWLKSKFLLINNWFSDVWQGLPTYLKSLFVVVFMPLFAIKHTVKTGQFMSYLKNTAIATLSVGTFFVSLSSPIPVIVLTAVKVFFLVSWFTGLYYIKDIIKADWKKLDKFEFKDFLPSNDIPKSDAPITSSSNNISHQQGSPSPLP